jgi:formylglycine-generating enzyme required for sulfatase activity
MRHRHRQPGCNSPGGAGAPRTLVFITMLLAFLAGCIPHYSDFVGAQDSQGDQVAEAVSSDGRSGDGSSEVVGKDGVSQDAERLNDVVLDDADALDTLDSHADTKDGKDAEDVPDVVLPTCGDGKCNGIETCDSCPADCGDCCGNQACDYEETCDTCPADCGGPCCGQGGCQTEFGEDKCSCPEDCGDPCADQECGDDGCGGSCGDCAFLYGEQYVCDGGDCVCMSACGGKECGPDGCDGTCGSCQAPTVCANGICIGCGDGECGAGEHKCNCPEDCSGGCSGCCAGTECKTENTLTFCGSGGEACDECTGGEQCVGGNCLCVVEDHMGCSGGKLYWYDSCDAKGSEVGDCDDGNPCTTDGCSGSQCTHSNVQNNTSCGGEKSCQSGVCKYHCGDGVCASTPPGTETCETCEGDCGPCPGQCEPGVSSGKKTNGQYGVVWVEIPAGCFMMGCSPGDGGCAGNEKPPHEVTVSSFEMLETEVTEGQWAAVVPGDPAPSCDYNGGGGANSPVECVNWNEAKAFCEAVDPKGRLCTEAEWEYAARGGTTTKYYCGDDSGCVGDVAWYSSNSGSHKHDVKGQDPNDYGLYDMLGNVWEWVEDCWHTDYDLNDDGDGDWNVGYPAWATNCSGSYRVGRGGSFYHYDGNLRVSDRNAYDPSDVYGSLGGRCCRSE